MIFVITFGCLSKLELECDRSQWNAQARRIGGPNSCPVKAHSKPWIARMLTTNPIFNKKNHICGGTIVSKNLVLTAKHCLKNRTPQSFVIAVGDHDIMKDDGEQTIEVADILTPKDGIGIKPELDIVTGDYTTIFTPNNN